MKSPTYNHGPTITQALIFSILILTVGYFSWIESGPVVSILIVYLLLKDKLTDKRLELLGDNINRLSKYVTSLHTEKD